MKNLFHKYLKILRFNGLYKSFAFIILLLSPLLLAYLNIGKLDNIGFFVIISTGIIFQTILNDFCEEKYMLLSMLPIKTKDIIKLLYMHTYFILGISLIIYYIACLINPSELTMLYSVFISFLLILCNTFYPYLASSELKLGSNHDGKASIWNLRSVFIILIAWLLVLFVYRDLETNYGFYFILSLNIINLCIAGFTFKKSYKTTLNKVIGVIL